MGLLSVGAKYATKALVKEAVPEVLETATKKAVKTKAVATNLDFLTKGRTKKQRLEIIDKHRSYGFDLEDSAYTEADLPQSIENVYNNAADGNWNGLSHAKQLETIDRIHGNGSIIPALVQEHGERTIRAPIDPIEALRANYAPREPEEAIANLQAAGADRLSNMKRKPRTIQGPVPPRLADKTYDQGARSYEEAVMAGTTKYVDEDGTAHMVRNYGSPTAPHGRVTKVDVRKMSGRGTEGRITWEKLLTLDKNAKGFYGVKIKGKEHAHHWNPIGVMKRVVEGLDPKVRNQLIAEAQDEFGLYSGNTMFNLRQLPTEIHDLVHKALDAAGYDPKKLQSFAKADYATRKEFLKRFAKDLSEIDEQLFQEVMTKTHGENWISEFEGLVPKKPKPTQFPEQIQRHITRSQEIGITEPGWKNASIDYTWRPQTNTGQIDIPPQSKKGFKGLRDEFFEQIEELPSGSVWELNPKFKDEKRRRIYARLFEGDPRITRNADETLGWVLNVP